jgi:hypothetical protein
MRNYKNRNSSFIYPIRLANKGFTLLLIFSFASILSDLNALLDALFDRRFYDNALIISKIRFLFQPNRDSMAR